MHGELPEGPQFPSPVVGKHNPKLQFFLGGRWLGTHLLSKFGGKGKILLHIDNLKLIFFFILR